jgi:hypothetical protein
VRGFASRLVNTWDATVVARRLFRDSVRLADTDRLTQMVGSLVEPRPTITFDVIPIDGSAERAVLELLVAPGTTRHACGPGREPGQSYIRQYATTVPARPAEIVAIVTSRRSPGGSFGWTFTR